MKKFVFLRMFRALLHVVFIWIIFWFSYRLRLVTDLIPGVQLRIPPINTKELFLFSFLAGILFFLIGVIKKLYELYRPTQRHFQTFSKTWFYWFITITFVAYFGYGFIFKVGISRFIISVGGIAVYVFLLIFDQIWMKFETTYIKNLNEKILIITTTDPNFEAIENIRKGFSYKSEIVPINKLNKAVLKNYFAIVVVGNFDKETLQELFEEIRLSDTRFFHVTEGYFLEDVVYSPEIIDKIIAIEYKKTELDGRSWIMKNIFDYFVAIIALLITFPIWILIAIAIKLDSKGPIFYVQKRVGKGGKLFNFIKFRSMKTDYCVGDKYGGKKAEEMYKKLINSDLNVRDEVLPKIKNDPRVTRVGKFLRKTSLDELPNLLCVLMGKMSIVGPRAHLPQEVEKYKAWQKRLLSIKPGITSYAQIYGRDNLSLDDEARLDLYYIQHWNIFLDLYIIFATLGVIFKGK